MAPRKKSAAARAAEYSSLAMVIPAATFIGYAIGWWLDKRFGTSWLSIVFLLLGSVGGFVSLIRQILRDSHDDRA